MEPIHTFQESRGQRLSAMPAKLMLYSDRVEYEKPGVVRNEKRSIRYDQVAQVVVTKSGLQFMGLTVESTGGGSIEITGLKGEEAETARSFIEQQTAASRGTKTEPPCGLLCDGHTHGCQPLRSRYQQRIN